MLRRSAPVAWLASLVLLTGCPADDTCVEVDVTSCEPLYPPTFENVFERTLVPSCGVEGSSCHAPEGAQNGLVFADIDDSHAALLDGRLEPGDPSCSLLVRRLESSDRGFRMPPGGRSLAAEERCAIERWIADGAQR